MTPQELDAFLRTPTPHEQLYRAGKLAGSPSDHFQSENGLLRLCAGGPEQELALIGKKHSRYRTYPAHVHPWVELVYMYSGSCTQRVNGRAVTLEKGQSLLLDQDAVHELPVLRDDDILLNICLWKDYLTAGFFNRISEKNIVSQFFINAVTEGMAHDSCMFFDSTRSRRLPLFIQEFFCELYDPGECSGDILKSLFILILTELIPFCEEDAQIQGSGQGNYTLPVLKYIESNYREINLKDTAAAFGLSPHYLSNLLKKKTGSSFQALVTSQRMLAACQLLDNSSLPVSEIANQVGYENTTFFYKKFQSFYGCSPSEYRRR